MLASTRSSSHTTPVKKKFTASKSNATFLWLFVLLLSIFVIGITCILLMTPSHSISSVAYATNSMLRESLSKKMMTWLPHSSHIGTSSRMLEDVPPDFKQEFWSPIDIEISSKDVKVTLCKLNFQKYTNTPHLYPMFRELQEMSECRGNNKKIENLSVLLKELDDNRDKSNGRVLSPSMFVFHESRVGSTLVANSLASDPWNMVYSESAPAVTALLHCRGCTRERNIKVFHDVVRLMGHSPFHKRLFFKFQSISSTGMDIALEAFPDTPWMYVYRQPVQTMMSHLDPNKGGNNGSPCLRSMRDPPLEIKQMLARYDNPVKEAWCAAHLNMLCTHALDAYKRYGMYAAGDVKQRGFIANYDGLPGMLPRLILPLFGIVVNSRWLAKMEEESKQYSKGKKGKAGVFTGDSADKEERATSSIQKYSKEILGPTYAEMTTITDAIIKSNFPDVYDKLPVSVNDVPNVKDLSSLRSIPTVGVAARVTRSTTATDSVADSVGLRTGSSTDSGSDSKSDGLRGASPDANDRDYEYNRRKHSRLSDKYTKLYDPWIPFSNTHHSKPFERIHCPPTPDADYPKEYLLTDITRNWNTDDTAIPANHYDSLCHFDYSNNTELSYASAYRSKDKPFIVYNMPELDAVANKWNDIDYLHEKIGNKQYRTETSESNHFMYFHSANKRVFHHSNGSVDTTWTPPTKSEMRTFEQWVEIAVKGQNKTLPERNHEYFRVTANDNRGDNSWLFHDLPFFQPKPSMMIVDPNEQRGIHCRFGMRSVIAEAHFDGSWNSVVMLGGLRRWILSHPKNCVNMHMLPRNHPSGRHSEIDWSEPDLVSFPNFAKILGNEVILQPGDFLYVPTYWIHYIVSLNVNIQCNTRSGKSKVYDSDITKCGF